METTQALLTIAELALVLAGFTGIVVAVNSGSKQSLPVERFRLVSLLSSSFITLFLALIPLGLLFLSLPDATCWRISSALQAATIVVLAILLLRRVVAMDNKSHTLLNKYLIIIIPIGSFINIVFQLLNVYGLFEKSAFAVYFFGLLWLLFYAALQFARVVVPRPTQR